MRIRNSESWRSSTIRFDQTVFNAGSTTIPSFTLSGFTAKIYSNKTNNQLGVTSVKQADGNVPTQFLLSQNFPNPFNPSTMINYQLPMSNLVTLKVFDILGREVATLVNERQEAGTYQTTFSAQGLSSGLSSKGAVPAGRQGYASGVYFYQLRAGNFSEVKKMLLMK